MLQRDFAAERPIMQSYDGAGVGRPGTTGVYDQGAGTYFEDGVRGEQYRRWCDANTKNGVRPEPMSKAQIEDSINRCARNELPTVSDKEHTRQWNRAWRAAQKDIQQAGKITLNKPA